MRADFRQKLPALPEKGTEQPAPDVRDQYERGIRTFALLFSRWMDLNDWSHPVMTALSKACLGGHAWLHSSQLSGFRQGRLVSPGPRAFIAIERLNYYLFRYKTEKKLIPGTNSSNYYSEPFVVTENGQPPELGWWFEVFCGAKIPTDIDLHQSQFSDAQAKTFSKEWGRFTRRQLVAEGYDLMEDLENAVRTHYPARDEDRVALILDVLRTKSTWTADQLTNELPALTAMSADLGGPDSEEALLRELS